MFEETPFDAPIRKHFKPMRQGDARRWARKRMALYYVPRHNDRHRLRTRAIKSYSDDNRYFDARYTPDDFYQIS